MSGGFGATDELLLRGTGAARDGDREQARFYLEWALRDDPTVAQFAEAWYWLSRIAEDPDERRRCLVQVLGAVPLHAEARRDLAILDGRLRESEIVDPRATIPPLALGGVLTPPEVRRHRCPRCGGAMIFDAAHPGLRCQFCGHRAADGEADGEAVREQDWEAAIYRSRGHRWVLPGERVLACEACGAVQTLAPGRTSGLCAFCGSSHVATAAASADLIAPEGIAPFAFDATEARRRLGEHLAQRRSRRDDARLSGPQRPLYLPFWTFDIEGEVRWKGYVERNNMRVPREGADHTHYDDLLVPAGGSVAADLLAPLQFDTRALVPYAPELLAGWAAEIYRIPVADASLRARERALRQFRERLYLTTEEEVHDLTVSSLGLAVVSYKLVLLPVWVATYRDGEGEGQLAISGQAGEAREGPPPGPFGRLLARLFSGGPGPQG